MAITTRDIEEFVRSVMGELTTGQTTEHSYRPAFKKLFSNIEKVRSVNEPKQSEYGAPDFGMIDTDEGVLTFRYIVEETDSGGFMFRVFNANLTRIKRSGS